MSILAFDMGFIGKVWDNLKRSFDTSWIVSCAIMGIIIINDDDDDDDDKE